MNRRPDDTLPRVLTFYRNLIGEYSFHVDWMRKAGISIDHKRDQQLVIGMLAISNYNSAKSILALYEADQGEQTLVFVRSQFEQAARADYFAKNKQRARDFLDLEPFERYKLAQKYHVRAALRETIVRECKEVVRQNPLLLRHQRKNAKGRRKADFLAIREALKLPPMEELLKALNWPPERYVDVYLFGSLRIHGSINDLRTYFEQNVDGSVSFAPEQDLRGPPDYLLQSSAYLLGFIGRIDQWFPGAGRDLEVGELLNQHHALANELGLDSTEVEGSAVDATDE
jgi:hypothetical protein